MTDGRKLRVVMISPNFHPYIGGAERQALELSKALQNLGVETTVLTRRRQGLASQESIEGIAVKRLWARGRGPSGSLSFMISIFQWLYGRSSEWDVAHVHLAGSHALPAALAGKFLMRPIFVKVGGGRGIGEIAVSSRTVLGRLKLKGLQWLKPRFVAVTKDLALELQEYGLGSDAQVIPNGVDTERFRPPAPSETKKLLRDKIGWPPGPGPFFIYAGRLAPEKRLTDFMEAFAQVLAETGAQAGIILTGEGSEEPGLRALAVKYGLLDKNVFFRGNEQDLDRIYLLADVFILPSESEGLSNALLEAMSCGLPVLASRVGGTAEAVQDGVSGFLFKPGDKNEMKLAIKRLLESPERIKAMGRHARETVEAEYDLRRIAERYLNLYRS